jgi:hypothetical protein
MAAPHSGANATNPSAHAEVADDATALVLAIELFMVRGDCDQNPLTTFERCRALGRASEQLQSVLSGKSMDCANV